MNKLTIFDLDETLVSGDTSVKWRRFLQDKGIIKDPDYSKKDDAMMREYAEGTLNLAQYIEFSMSPIADLKKAEVNKLVKQCVEERVLSSIYKEAKATIKTLLEKSPEDILIISATVAFIVKEVASHLGIKNSLGVNLEEDANFYKPIISGIPSFREHKVTRLKQWLDEQGKSDYYDKLTFYTDSINDLPLCEYSDEVYTVNPCKQLRPIAEQRGWQILNWS